MICFTILAFLSLGAGLAAADYLKQEFQDMDLSGDGRVTWKEYKYYITRPNPEPFQEADLNGDHQLELFEWVSFQNQQFPDMAESKYKYTDRNGQLYRFRNGQWYKRTGDFWYQYQDKEWHLYSSAHRYRSRYYDCYDHRDWCRYRDWDRWRYGYGFSYYRGKRSGYGFGIGVSRGWYW